MVVQNHLKAGWPTRISSMTADQGPPLVSSLIPAVRQTLKWDLCNQLRATGKALCREGSGRIHSASSGYVTVRMLQYWHRDQRTGFVTMGTWVPGLAELAMA